ncbi:MAG TPA: tetratricopeptide repeat protein [Deltaproteobacteria bacterium]|nr:tetratricopeptide repeat protein [Deltaproteobacteria bacterium]
MLTPQEIEIRIKEWESQTTEFKREFSTDPIRQTMVAFANDYSEAGGGVIIIGVDPDTRSVVGLKGDPEETLRRITGLCRDGSIVPTIAPEIYHLNVAGKTVAVVEIKRSERRPHRANNICYIRIGPTTRKATPDEEFEIIRRSGRFPFDMMPVREATVEDLNLLKFEQEFLPKRVSSETLAANQRSPVEWAEHLKFLVREGEKLVPTVAAILLFGKNPQAFLPHSSIDFIRFEGDDPSYPIVDRKEITGTIDEQIKTVVEIVEHYMVRSYRFSQKSPVRTDIVEYPLRAVREAVANAVMHRDYEISRTNVSIKMFDDRLEVLSPGGLYGIVTKENFGTGVNDYRNPTLAVNLNLLGLVEKAGTGIFLIRRQMRENGSSDPVFEIGDRYLLVKLPAHPYYLGVRLYQKGLVALEQGNRDEAANLFKKSAEIAPHFPEVWAAIGRMEGLYGDIEEARRAFQRAIEENPQFEKAYLEWGKIEDQAGNTVKSQEIFRQGTQAIPDSSDIWYAWALLEEKLRNWRKALGLLRKAVSLQPNDPRVLRKLGNIAFRLRELDEARDCLRKALQYVENDKEKGKIFFELMKVLIEQRASREEIEECFHSAYSLNFRPQELFYRYHRYLTNRGEHAAALEVLELARREGIHITPALPELYIGNLPTEVPKKRLIKEVKELFRKAGIEVTKIYIHPSRGFGFVTITSEADVEKAISSLNRTVLLGRAIVVDRKR